MIDFARSMGENRFETMQHANVSAYLSRPLAPGPVAILLMEDYCETDSTLRHHLRLGFPNIVALAPSDLEIAPDLAENIDLVPHDFARDNPFETLNRMIPALEGHWVYYGFNAEYLFYPFSETRSIGELTRFVSEERRDSILTYAIDLYAEDLGENSNGVSLQTAHLDQAGYYAHARWREGQRQERQLDMFGGLRWRFEEHIPWERRKIDRIGLFLAQKGLKLRPDHTFNIEEYNTYACKWHHNVTAAICSFRVAKSLRTNPGSAAEIDQFTWGNSRKFTWDSHQLMELGLMEPGQWF